MKRTTVDCGDPHWSEKLRAQLESGSEVDLINFDYHSHGSACELLARAFHVEFSLDRDPRSSVAKLRRNSAE